MTSRAGAGWRAGITSRLTAGQSSMLWLLVGLGLCLAGQVLFHLRLSVFDGVVLYAAGTFALWRFARVQALPGRAALLAPGLSGLSPARRKVMVIALAAALLTLLAVLLMLAPSMRVVPVQLLVLAAAALWVWAGHATDARRFTWPSLPALTVSWRHRLGLAAVLLAAVAARVWDLGGYPEGLWYDEARIGLEAWRILTDADFRPVYSDGTTTPAAYIYLVSWMEAVFGKTVFAIRLASALPGVASTVLVYIVGRLAFGYRVGLIAAGLFALARWDINFSRIAMQGATTPTLSLLVVAAGLAALRTGRLSLYALVGAAMGALLWFYTSNVFLLAVVLVPLVALAILQPREVWRQRRGLLVAIAGAVLVATPVVVSTLTSPAEVLSRPQQASVFATTPPDALAATIWDSANKHLGMLQVAGDRNGRHNLPGAPMLDAVTAVFMVVGLVIAAAHWRDPRSLLMLAWVPLMLLPGILSVAFEAPQALRGIGAVAPAVLLAGLGLSAATTRLQPETGNLLAAVLVLLAGASNVSTYFGLQRQDGRVWQDFSMGATILARQLQQAEDKDRVYGSVHYAGHPTVAFLNGRAATKLEPEAHLPLRDGNGATYVFAEEEPVYYALASAYYPDAGCGAAGRSPQQPTAYTCAVTDPMVAATRGLPVTVVPEGASQAGARPFVATSGIIALPQADAPWRVSAIGSLLASQGGVYRFRLEAAEDLGLFLDGQPIVTGGSEGSVTLAQGLHLLELQGRARGGEFRLLWATPQRNALVPVPPEALYRGTVRPMGLAVGYRSGEAYAGQPALSRIEPAPHLYYHVPPLERPFTAEWTGSLIAPVSGAYRFRTTAVSSAQVEIGGRVVWPAAGQPGPEVTVELQEGVHPIRIRHVVADGYAHLYLTWRPPGRQTFEHIPPERLRPW